MKKKMFFESKGLIIGLSFVLAVFIFCGCATSGGGETVEPGTLSIKGIPAAFEGKYLSARITSISEDGRWTNIEGSNTAVVNGETELPLSLERIFGKNTGYDGSHTGDARVTVNEMIVIPNPGSLLNPTFTRFESSDNFIFTSVTFENGVAAINWSDGVKIGINITINGIPAEYNAREANVFVDFPEGTMRGGQNRSAVVRNGSITVQMLYDNSGAYLPSAFSGTKSVSLAFPDTSRVVSVVVPPSTHFRNVQFSNGNAVINWR